MSPAFAFAVVLTVAWGALAFGAVYPWGFWPLVVSALLVGLWGFTLRKAPGIPAASVLVAFGLVAVVIALTLVPLPQRILTAISPATDRLLRSYDLTYAAGSGHPLSIRPDLTWLALVAFIAFAIFCLGSASGLSVRRATIVTRGVTVLAAVVAVFGLVQKASGTMMIYGFWQPYDHPYQIFGPFVNKNHYAGWMIMALSLTIGSIGAAVAESERSWRRGWRDRVLWVSSGDGSYVLLALVCTPIMIAALLATLSRSGIASFAFAVALAGICLAIRARRRKPAVVLAAVYVVIAVLFVGEWSRLDAVVQRFQVGSAVSLHSRFLAWQDAGRIARDFPVFGSGLDSFDTAMLFYQTHGGAHWNAAHNDYVQVAADGGLLLAGAALIALALLGRLIARRLKEDGRTPSFWLRLGAVLGLLAIGLQEGVDFSLQVPGNAVLCAALVALAIREPPK